MPAEMEIWAEAIPAVLPARSRAKSTLRVVFIVTSPFGLVRAMTRKSLVVNRRPRGHLSIGQEPCHVPLPGACRRLDPGEDGRGAGSGRSGEKGQNGLQGGQGQ